MAMSKNERIAVLENEVKKMSKTLEKQRELIDTLFQRQETLSYNDVMFKKELDKVKEKEKPQYMA